MKLKCSYATDKQTDIFTFENNIENMGLFKKKKNTEQNIVLQKFLLELKSVKDELGWFAIMYSN